MAFRNTHSLTIIYMVHECTFNSIYKTVSVYVRITNYVRVYKSKEGNNRPSSVYQISLIHNHDKSGNKCYTQDNTNTLETQVCE